MSVLGRTLYFVDDDDLHLALYLSYELHYRGLPGVDEGWEWEPSLLRFRAELEQRFEQALLQDVPFEHDVPPAEDMDLALREIAERKPRNLNELSTVQGVGAAKLERYGEAMLAALSTNG